MPVSLECCVTQSTVYSNQMSCPWDTRVATLWVLMLSVTSSVRLEVYQSITARCRFITFQYFCKNDQGHLSTIFPLSNFFVRIVILKYNKLTNVSSLIPKWILPTSTCITFVAIKKFQRFEKGGEMRRESWKRDQQMWEYGKKEDPFYQRYIV